MFKGLFVCLLFPSLGEAHFSAYQKPLLYFEVLFLTGQFEAVSLLCSGNPILTIVHWRFYSFAGSKTKVNQFIDLVVVIFVFRIQLIVKKIITIKKIPLSFCIPETKLVPCPYTTA